MHTFDDEGADVAQGCCEWPDNRLVGRTTAGLKGLLASSNVCGRRSHYREHSGCQPASSNVCMTLNVFAKYTQRDGWLNNCAVLAQQLCGLAQKL